LLNLSVKVFAFGWWVGFGVEYWYLLMYFAEADKDSVSRGG